MVLQNWYTRFKKSGRSRYVIVGGIVLVVLIADVVGYKWYSRRYNDRAQMALSQAIEVLDKAVTGNVPTLWKEAEHAFRDGYQRYPRAATAPYLLSYWADTVLHQGDLTRALDLMDKAILALSKSSPLYYAFVVKRALMRMDSPDATLVAEGKKDLHACAQDKKNARRDEAIYFEGLVAFDSGNRAEAEKIWQELATSFGEKSVWTQVAQGKLEYRV